MGTRFRAHGAAAIATAVAGLAVIIVQPGAALSAVQTRQAVAAAGTDDPVPVTRPTKPAVARPVISSISPASGPTQGGTVVTLLGSKFTTLDSAYAASITFGGVPATRFVVSTDDRMLAWVPPGAKGDVEVRATNIVGSDLGAVTYGYRAELAVEFADVNTRAGGGEQITVAVTGGSIGDTAAQFKALKIVAKVGGVVSAATWVDSQHLKITAPKSTTGAAVTVQLVYDGYTGPESTGKITYYPEVSKVAPAVVDVEGGANVTITGNGFHGVDIDDPSAVTFGGVPASFFEVVSATQITAVAPPSAIGPAAVRVNTSGGANPDTTATLIAYRGPLSIDTTGDQFVRANGGAHVFTVNGGPLGDDAKAFAAEGIRVKVSGSKTLLTPVWVDSERLRLNLPAPAAGPIEVSLVQGPITGPVINLPVAPVVTAMSPLSDTIAGGKPVRITVAGGTGATDFMFGDTPATCTVVKAPIFECTAPAADAAGPVAVSFTSGDGTASRFTSTAMFSYTDLD